MKRSYMIVFILHFSLYLLFTSILTRDSFEGNMFIINFILANFCVIRQRLRLCEQNIVARKEEALFYPSYVGCYCCREPR